MQVYNTKYRNKTLTVTKFQDGVVVSITSYNITSDFTGHVSLTDAAFQQLSDADYLIRLAAFYDYVDTMGGIGLNSESIATDAYGVDAVACPLNQPV